MTTEDADQKAWHIVETCLPQSYIRPKLGKPCSPKSVALAKKIAVALVNAWWFGKTQGDNPPATRWGRPDGTTMSHIFWLNNYSLCGRHLFTGGHAVVEGERPIACGAGDCPQCVAIYNVTGVPGAEAGA